MAIRKTVVTLTDGNDTFMYEEEGQQNSIVVDNLTPSTLYNTSAYVDDDYYGQIDSTNQYKFTTLTVGEITLKDAGCKIDTSKLTFDVLVTFTSTYNADSATIFVDDNDSFKDPSRYEGKINGTTSGSIYCSINDYPFVLGETYYFQVYLYDIYGKSAMIKLSYVYK